MRRATPTDAAAGFGSNATVSTADRRRGNDDAGPDRSRADGERTPALAHRRRRAVASFVAAAGDSTLRTVVSHVTALEYDPTVESSRLEWRQRVHVSLRRTHLPRLDEEGIVDYDDAIGTVRPGGRLAASEPAADAEPQPGDDPVSEPAAGVSVEPGDEVDIVEADVVEPRVRPGRR